MGLTALTTQGDRIESLSYASGREIRTRWSPGELLCPFCQGEVFVRDRAGFLLHFVHKSKCTTTLGHHPESPEHLYLKKLMVEWYRRIISKAGREKDIDCQLEYPIKEAGEHGRITDVAIVYKKGWILATEIQLSPITTDELEKRTLDYEGAGVDVIWVLCGKANTLQNKDWLIYYQGACHQAYLEERESQYCVEDFASANIPLTV